MTAPEQEPPIGIRFDRHGLTVPFEDGRSTRIVAGDIVEITAQPYGSDDSVTLTIEAQTAGGSLVVSCTDHAFAFAGLVTCLGRFPGFDLEWQSKLSADRLITIYRTYSEPLS